MKRNNRGMMITLLIVIILLVTIFGSAYYLLPTNYISKRMSVNLEKMTDSVSVDLNRKVNRDYQFFLEYVNNNLIDEEINETFGSKEKEDLKKLLSLQTEVYYGYINGTSGLHLENRDYSFKSGNDFLSEEYYNKNVSFYSLNSVLLNYEDNNKYVFFRVEDFFIYFSMNEYLNSIFLNDEGMPDNYYFLFRSTGKIIYQKDLNSKKDILKQYYLQEGNATLDYDNEIYSNLVAKKTGSIVVNFGGNKSFLVYSPCLVNDFDQDLFVGYAFDYEDVTNSMGYLKTTLIILSVTTVLAIIGIVVIYGYRFYKQEEDISAYNSSQFFAKPFSVKVNGKGKILFTNMSFKKNIKNHKNFKNANDFIVLESIDNILDHIKKQKSFTAIFDSTKGEDKLYIHFVPMRDFMRFYLLGDDITSAIKEQEHINNIANFNQVTQLPNLNFLRDSLKKLNKSPLFNSTFNSLVAIDIIDFTKANNIYGFVLADRMLREIAKVINASIEGMKGTIEVYNIRTSLFVVLFKDVESHNDVISWAKTTFEKLTEPISIREDYLVQVEPKMGVLNIDHKTMPNISADEMYGFVMKALDRAKKSRVTKIGIYNAELGRALSRDQVMEADIKQGMEKGEFVMYFQPQYNTKLEKIVGFESLVRWNNPKYLKESSEHYITLAERNGMIIELGKIINEKVFSFAKQIEDTGISISLNISPVQLLQSGFVSELLEDFKKFELKPGSIVIEITETFLISNRELMINKLKILRENGFLIHLDDFGVEYSSLFYLKDLPVDAIKIDKGFIDHMMTDKTTRVIISKVIQMALSLGIELVAEGVESEKQSDTLSHMGCDVIQGWLISKAVPAEETFALIKKYNEK